MHRKHIFSGWYSPFFRFEPRGRVSWNEEERTHWVHVTKRWKKTRTYRTSIRIQETEQTQRHLHLEKLVLTWCSFSHLDSCDTTRPQITLRDKTTPVNQNHNGHTCSDTSSVHRYNTPVLHSYIMLDFECLRRLWRLLLCNRM